MVDDRTIFDEPHYQSLELLATEALSNGNIATAFKLADRRCRILPLPEAHCYILRSEASFQLDAKTAALADLAKALEIAPENIAANRRMLAWAQTPQEKLQAATALIRGGSNFELLHTAIRLLRTNGQRNFACVTVLADAIEGWAIWEGAAPLTISIAEDDDNKVTTVIDADVFHAFSGYGQAANFSVTRPKAATNQSVLLSTADSVFYSKIAPANSVGLSSRAHRPQRSVARVPSVTVIVPVYGDYAATRLCLDTLLAQPNFGRCRVIMVNDATPDSRIAKYLTKLKRKSRVSVLINERNVGFAASVNRALGRVEQGDVILLNSDTVVPPGFIGRLATAAHAAPDIGTVTPLSNNGEFSSFPIPNAANPLPSRKEINRIDQIATKANSGRLFDIPSGIGFCLYITRACLDSVGPLSADFGPGYLEDADFCLRARQHGFRNVCAPSVYVGHAGSKSFGKEKRSLVVHNLGIIEQRFPKHRSECGAFMLADPLRDAREAIERIVAATPSRPRILVTGSGAVAAIAHARARKLASSHSSVLILEIRHEADGRTVNILDAGGDVPQSLQFNLADPNQYAALMKMLRTMRPSRIEFLDPANTPAQLTDLLRKLKVPYDIFVADAGLLGPRCEPLMLAACRSPISRKTDAGQGQEVQAWLDHWKKIADGARKILVPCREAEALAVSLLPRGKVKRIGRHAEKSSRAPRKGQKAAANHIGLVPIRCSAHEQQLMHEIAKNFRSLRPDVSIIIVGATLDDVGLMRSGNMFVTGAIGTDEFESLATSLGLGHLFVCVTQPLFGHPILTAARSSWRPTAYFDWSKGRVKPSRKRDLSIDAGSSIDHIIRALDQWMPGP